LNKAKVGMNNGMDFGMAGRGFVRMNFACPRTILAEGLSRMAQAIKHSI